MMQCGVDCIELCCLSVSVTVTHRLLQRKVRNTEVEQALLDITELARHQKITIANIQKLNRVNSVASSLLGINNNRRKSKSTRSLMSGVTHSSK